MTLRPLDVGWFVEKSSGIKGWPEQDRPREKLMQRGAAALSSSELLAVLLRTGDAAGNTAVDVARGLWTQWGECWQQLSQASPLELTYTPGIGPAKAATLAAAFEIGRRMAQRPLAAEEPFRSSHQVFDHFCGRLGHIRKENFFCLLLDARNRYLREEHISEGTLTASLVHPREAFRAAVRESASAVIFAHNHPSGDPQPSAEDQQLTHRLWEAGKLLGIRVLDHVIVGHSTYFSFADEGALASL